MNDDRLAIEVRYLPNTREVEIRLDDFSGLIYRVDRLEMLVWTGEKLVEIAKPSDEDLADVRVWGGGDSIYWPKLEQVFAIADLQAGIYGRPVWMQRLSVSA